MKYYKTIINKELFESTYNISLEEYDLYSTKGISSLPTICENCGEEFWIDVRQFKKRLNYTEHYHKCFGDTWFCTRKECQSKKKSLVCIDRMLKSETSISKRLDAAKKRRGKSYEEQYGIERATEIKSVIKEKRAKQEEPMKGKHHSDKAKLKMSLSKRELISKGELSYTNAITGEPCTFTEEIASKTSLWHKNPENRKAFATTCLDHTLKAWISAGKSTINRWFDNKVIACQSTYEKAYAELLNANKVYYDRCEFVIPYVWDSRICHYTPDFVLYSDNTCTKVTHVVEVKSSWAFTSTCIYAQRNKEKLKVLDDFCRYNNYIKVVITEEQLHENKIY